MRRALISAIAFLLAIAVALPVVAQPPGGQKNFRASLSGSNEIPEVDSNAAGVALFKLSESGDELKFKLNVANLEDIVQAHIHCGSPDVNGPVVAFLFGPASPTVTVNGTLSEGVITAADIIPLPDSPECPGGVADFDDLIEKMRTGDAYANVHTIASPTGEIRGQIR